MGYYPGLFLLTVIAFWITRNQMAQQVADEPVAAGCAGVITGGAGLADWRLADASQTISTQAGELQSKARHWQRATASLLACPF